MKRGIHIFIVALLLGLAACVPGKKDYLRNWEDIADTNEYAVDYLQIDFSAYPAEEYMDKAVTDFSGRKGIKKVKLTGRQQILLSEFISDTMNFSQSDCGTFHLNAGFIIYRKGEEKGLIDIGCGFNQWNFMPHNPKSGAGSVTEKGFREMEALLDDINK